MAANEGKAKARFDQLVPLREPFLVRARDCAKLTIPYLMPPPGFNGAQRLPTPYQSLGARGVRTLASKLLLALFTPPFFKYDLADATLKKLTGKDDMRGEIEKAFASRERAITLEMDRALFRSIAATALKHLVVTGNFLIYVPPKGRVKGFRLDQYVVKRDPAGNVLEMVVKECVAPTVLPQEVAAAALGSTDKGSHSTVDNTVELYTHIERTKDNWTIYQEAGGVVIRKSMGTYPLDRCPWIVVRIESEPGEDYGRSYVEEYLGDLDSLEGLSETLVEGSAAAARILFLVKPNGVTKVQVVAKARNGDVHAGNAEDVTVVRTDKQADLSVAQKQAEEISQRLAYAFLLNTAIQRNAERVTAEEIRFMAQELDDALGGIYTLLSSEFQLEVVQVFETRMEKTVQVPPLPKGVAHPVITSGFGALGRGIDLKNLKAFTADIIQTLTPQVAMRYLNMPEYIKRASAAYNIDADGLIKSDTQIAAEEQAAKLSELAQNLGPQALTAAGGIGKEVVKHQLQQGTNGTGQAPGG